MNEQKKEVIKNHDGVTFDIDYMFKSRKIIRKSKKQPFAAVST